MTVRAEILTSQGTSNVGGAIGVIQLSGPAGAALDQVGQLVRGKQLKKITALMDHPLGEGANICLVNLYDPRAGEEGGGELIDQALVVATSKTKIELHLHGGLAVLRRIMNVLGELGVNCGVDPALVENNHEELSAGIESEVLAALSAALTQTAVQLLAAQIGEAGLLGWGRGWIRRIKTPQDVLRCQNEIQWVLDRSRVLQRFLVVPRVVLAGQPNVGKSTLMNALLGRAVSITSAQAGTTRDWVDAPILLSSGIGSKQVEVAVTLIDTAGVRSSTDIIEELAVERSWEQIRQADLVLAMMDVSTLHDPHDQAWLAGLARTCDTHGITLLQVNNKSDLRVQNKTDRTASTHPVIWVSALQQQGLEALVEAMLAGLGVRDIKADSGGGGGWGEPWAFTPRQQNLLQRAGVSQTATEVVTLLRELCSGSLK